MKIPPPTEHEDMHNFFDMLFKMEPRFPLLKRVYHVPNGRDAGSTRKGGIWKGLGVRSGVPDVIVDIPVYPYYGMRIEFKRQGINRLDPEQLDFYYWYTNNGFRHHTANKGPEEAWNAMRIYLLPIMRDLPEYPK